MVNSTIRECNHLNWSPYIWLVPMVQGKFTITRSCTGYWLKWLMMTSSNGNIFRVTGPLWGESIGHRWIPFTKASVAEFLYFPWSAPEQRLSKLSRRRWFETSSHSLWRFYNVRSSAASLAQIKLGLVVLTCFFCANETRAVLTITGTIGENYSHILIYR